MNFDWQDGASCKGESTAMFFPEPGVVTDATRQALALCRECPVRNPCLDHAMEHREPGIWGGMMETERRKLRRFRMRPNEMWRHGWNYEDQRGWNMKVSK